MKSMIQDDALDLLLSIRDLQRHGVQCSDCLSCLTCTECCRCECGCLCKGGPHLACNYRPLTFSEMGIQTYETERLWTGTCFSVTRCRHPETSEEISPEDLVLLANELDLDIWLVLNRRPREDDMYGHALYVPEHLVDKTVANCSKFVSGIGLKCFVSGTLLKSASCSWVLVENLDVGSIVISSKGNNLRILSALLHQGKKT